MNKIVASFLLFLATGSLYAQQVGKQDVPPAVLRSYISQNSRGALDSAWSKSIVTIYKVNYVDEGKRYEAQYFEDGKWIKTFTEIPQTDLMKGVTNQIIDLYPNHRIIRVTIELNNDGKFYAVDLAKGNDRITVYFLMSGLLVK
jgi:hypothetical protein